MGAIEDRDYETVTARCDECGSLCTFNRVDDIGEPGPYFGRDVTCSECGRPFWIYGDSVNPPFGDHIISAHKHARAKQYGQCVISLGRAWETFFAAYIYSNYLYRPYYANERYHGKVDQFNRLSKQLHGTIEQATFRPLRKILINTVVECVHPEDLDESELAIPRIKAEKFGRKLDEDRVNAFPDPLLRDVLLRLQNLGVDKLRNRVVHKESYRPRRGEVDRCLDEIDVLIDARRRLPVYTHNEWRIDLRF